MPTIIQLDSASNPIGVTQFAYEQDIPTDLPDNNIVMDLPEKVSADVFLRQWRLSDGTFIDAGEPPTSYHRWNIAAKAWVDSRTPETQWELVKIERLRKLQASDWTQLPDVPLAIKEAWATYRQALRDITNQPDPFNIIWPEPPQ